MPNSPVSPLCANVAPVKEAEISARVLSAEWRRQLGVEPSPAFSDDAVFRLWRCPRSQLRFITPWAPGDGKFYAAMRVTPGYYQADKWEHRQTAAQVGPGARVLDVGCGDGAFLRRCAEFGAHAEGLELNPAAVAHGRASGLTVHERTAEAHLAFGLGGSYDLVCAFQVLEHVAEPLAFLSALAELTRPGGRLVIGVPNCDGWVSGSGSVYQWPPHHLTWWGRASLAYLPQCLPITLDGIEQEPLRREQRRDRVIALLDPHLIPGRRGGGLAGRLRRRLTDFVNPCLSHVSFSDGETLLAVYTRRQ